MRISILALMCCMSQAAFAGGTDSCAVGSAVQTASFSLATRIPNEPSFSEPRTTRYVPEYKIRKKLRIANRLMYTGGVLLLASVPVFVAAAVHDNNIPVNQQGVVQRGNGGSFYLGIFGGLIAGAGVGLVVPGSILHFKYKRQLGAQYPSSN